MAEDIVRVLRIIEYVGPRNRVEQIVTGSIHGCKMLGQWGHPERVTITAVTMGDYPEILEKAKENASDFSKEDRQDRSRRES